MPKSKSAPTSYSQLPEHTKQQVYVILLFCFLIGFGGSFLYQSRNQFSFFKNKNAVTPASQNTGPQMLALSAPSTLVHVNTPFTVTITLDSTGRGIEAADFVLFYDALYLKVIRISEGTFFKQWPIKKVESDEVKLTGVASLAGNKLVVPKGKGNVATITFTPIALTHETTVSFHPDKTHISSGGINIFDPTRAQELTVRIDK